MPEPVPQVPGSKNPAGKGTSTHKASSAPEHGPSFVIPASTRQAAGTDKVLCERCGTEMFRMHAVWRCPVCRFKTDCCGW